MTDSDLLRKLAVKPGERVALLEPPAGYDARFAGPDHPLVAGEEGAASVAVLFAPEREAFERGFDALTRAVRQGGRVWVSYPKRLKSDLNRTGVVEVCAARGWTPVTQIAIDDDWSAMRLRPFDEVGR